MYLGTSTEPLWAKDLKEVQSEIAYSTHVFIFHIVSIKSNEEYILNYPYLVRG